MKLCSKLCSKLCLKLCSKLCSKLYTELQTGRLGAAPPHSTAHRRMHVTLHGPLSPTSYSIIVKNQALFTIVILIQSSVNLNRILPLLFTTSPFSLRQSNGNY